MLTIGEVKAYLSRIGIHDIESPTLSYLSKLHSAHVQLIPWETVDIFAGNPVPIDMHTSIGLIMNLRSGYCFHLNRAFGELLRTLGYRVSWHRGGVQPLGEEPRINGFHLGLTVELENEGHNVSKWIVDVGLGDMPFEPIPLQTGQYEQGPFLYKVMDSHAAKNGWRLEHDPHGSFAGVDYDPDAVIHLDEFNIKHEFYSRSKQSPWINLFLVRHRHATGSNELKGCMWMNRTDNSIEKTEITSKKRWFEILGDVFGEHLVNYSRFERDEIWERVNRSHDEWKRRAGL